MFKEIFCKPIQLHAWNQWSITEQGTIHRQNSRQGVPIPNSERTTGNYVVQRRQCALCGLTQIMRQEVEKPQ